LDGHGAGGPVKVLFTTIHRRELKQVEAIIHEVNPKMFYSVEEVRASSEGVFHPRRREQLMSKFDVMKKK
jgi:hypothetical protein